MPKEIVVLIILLTTSCNLVPTKLQEVPSGRKDSPTLNSASVELKAKPAPDCKNLIRQLNPSAQASDSASDLDRYFYLAYDHETAGDFEGAILNYRKAAELSKCDCDRLHAEAGEKAAMEAKKLFEEKGASAKATQFFWGKLKLLTQGLPCVEVKQ
jgi:tetratricopeptide (TPR) repeat protein